MKISQREIIILIITLFTVLLGLTYKVGGPKLTEHRQLVLKKASLKQQLTVNKKTIDQQASWTNRLAELQSQLPVYKQNSSPVGTIRNHIRSLASQNGIDLTGSRTHDEKQVGNLFETSIVYDWEGTLDALVGFLFQMNEQGLRYDIRELSVRPDARRANILTGDIIIDCAYRRESSPTP